MPTCPLCHEQDCGCKERLREQHDLDVIGYDYIREFRRSGAGFTGVCPFHEGATNRNGLSVYFDRQKDHWRFKCFAPKCSATGDVFELLHRLAGLDFTAALHWMADKPMPVVQRFKPAERPPTPEEIEWERALRYHRQLGQRVGNQTAYEWWLSQGLDAATIDRFRVGYAPACPTYKSSPSLTIPISFCPGTPERKLVGIRHRLWLPPDPTDKYRPDAVGQPATLFGTETIFFWPDGSERQPHEREELVIVEGEKKLMVACRWGIDNYMSIVTATAGATSWNAENGAYWAYKLQRFRKVYVVFDPDAEEAADRVAGLFGRRGFVTMLPEKLDDLLAREGEQGFNFVMNALCDAEQPRERSYWQTASIIE